MYYIEFYSRKPSVDIETFHKTVTLTDDYWAKSNPQDKPVLWVGRTWRLGGPHYIRVWEIDSATRLNEWKQQRVSDPEAAAMIDLWLTVVDCDAGLYEDFGEEQL